MGQRFPRDFGCAECGENPARLTVGWRYGTPAASIDASRNRPRYTGFDCDRAVHERRQVPFDGCVGGGHADHAKWRAGQLRVPSFRGDDIVDVALVDYAVKKYAAKKPGMILINNPWGELNEKGLKAALDDKKLPYAGIEKFETNDVHLVPQLTRLKQAGAACFHGRQRRAFGPGREVARPHELGRADRIALGPIGWPVLRTRGSERRQGAFHSDLQLLRQAFVQGRGVLAGLKKKYPEIKSLADVTPAVGIANAYDAMHLTALGSPRPDRPRARRFAMPFTPSTSTTG